MSLNLSAMELRNFLCSVKGSIIPTFAVSVFVILGMVAVSVDYSQTYSARQKALAIADNALLSGVQETRRQKKLGASDSFAIQKGIELANASFDYHAADIAHVANVVFTPEIEFDDTEIRGVSSVTGEVPLSFAKAVGTHTAALDVSNTVLIGGLGETHIHFVVDHSGSMAIGATPADVSLTRTVTGNCSFACHNTIGPVRAAGVELRLDVLRATIIDLVGKLEARNQAGNISVSVSGFSNILYPRLSDTTDMNAARQAVNAIDYLFGGGNTPIQTDFGATLGSLLQITPTPANTTKRQAVVLVTDGFGRNHGIINPSFCAPLKDTRDAQIYTVNLIRLSPTNGQPESNNAAVTAAMEACASDPSKAFVAATPEEIEQAFEQLLEELEGDLRVSS